MVRRRGITRTGVAGVSSGFLLTSQRMAPRASCGTHGASASAGSLGSWRLSSPRPASSSHCEWQLRTSLLDRMQDLRRQRWVALTMAALAPALTNPRTLEQGSLPLDTQQDRRFLAWEIIGRRCEAPRCFFLFSRSRAANALCGSSDRLDLASRQVALTERSAKIARTLMIARWRGLGTGAGFDLQLLLRFACWDGCLL